MMSQPFQTDRINGASGATGEGWHLRHALVVDDHPLFCDALSMTLKAVAGFAQIDTADRLETAIARLGAAPLPDVVVLDLHLPDVDGLDGLLRLKAVLGANPQSAPIKIVVVSSLADNRVIGASLRAGAAGFVPKHSPRELFRAAFAAIARGEIWTPEGYVPPQDPKAPASLQEEAVARLALLTRQQARILQLVCEGKLNKQIAYELSIAETTVKAHVTAIMRKLAVQSRTQAVLVARDARFDLLRPAADARADR